MKRVICNVGQGGMCIEDFGSYKVVFDCGTKTRKPEETIGEFFCKSDIIKAVFISHLDADHVNCLEELIKLCCVERVFIPLITDMEFALLQCKNFTLGGAPLVDFIGKLRDGTVEGTRIIHVQPASFASDDGAEPLDITADFNLDIREISSRTEIIIGRGGDDKSHKYSSGHQWVFVPFNFRYDKRHKTLLDELHDLLSNINSLGSIPSELAKRLDKDLLDKLKKFYKEGVPGSINGNSMVVYSGVKYTSCTCYQHCGNLISGNMFVNGSALTIKCGCLYTGDYEAGGPQKWSQLQACYSRYWDNIGLFQIPHHGSAHNFNNDITLSDATFFVCAGYNNGYKHPHQSVLKHMISSSKPFFWVNERDESLHIFDIKC